jgi:hypothetical protein
LCTLVLFFKIGPYVYKYIHPGVNAWIGCELEEDCFVEVLSFSKLSHKIPVSGIATTTTITCIVSYIITVPRSRGGGGIGALVIDD